MSGDQVRASRTQPAIASVASAPAISYETTAPVIADMALAPDCTSDEAVPMIHAVSVNLLLHQGHSAEKARMIADGLGDAGRQSKNH